ncbi:hypothetical protein DFR24_3785 [Panacagrimonas perspica]|uniref:Uncharacterized protein n=1 Tax=Panacagrimonas perspica TaxID=381431 RepID=A0A4R7NZG5_9GAMM|nr:hypothetical protein [Panacagrimonas perspica]TDU26755.1 hypothetical protein DFR24_3785 [Panacagrimonas perspica]THD04092.1 hypothetical protein B1810_07545 [Panacagrimonas perspica]
MKRGAGRTHYDQDPFTDLLFNALLGFTMLFMIAITSINPPAKKQGDIPAKAEMIVTTTWADGLKDDVDTWIEAPDGEIVWYRNPDGGLMHLDRDDRGAENDTLLVDGKPIVNPLNQEVVTVRGVLPGEYIVNVQRYHASDGNVLPVEVNVVKVNPVLKVVYYGTVDLPSQGAERTVVRFTVGPDGAVSGINTLQKNLVQQ